VTDSTPTSKTEWFEEGLQFACTQCGNCCTGPSGYVWFDDAELAAMAARFEMTINQFRKRYARKIHGRWSLAEVRTEHGYDCIFLKRDPESGNAGCSIYEDRPQQCRTWPFWRENLRSLRNYINAARDCPGMTRGLEGQGNFYPAEKIRILRDSTPE